MKPIVLRSVWMDVAVTTSMTGMAVVFAANKEPFGFTLCGGTAIMNIMFALKISARDTSPK